MNRELIRSTAFIRAARRYLKKHPQAAEDLEATLLLLSEDAFDPRLKSHKLKGDLTGVWACSGGCPVVARGPDADDVVVADSFLAFVEAALNGDPLDAL